MAWPNTLRHLPSAICQSRIPNPESPPLRYPAWPDLQRDAMPVDKNLRDLEPGIHTDLEGRLTYGGY
ncbi:hypothetical protein, partial [Xanthomonas citri]